MSSEVHSPQMSETSTKTWVIAASQNASLSDCVSTSAMDPSNVTVSSGTAATMVGDLDGAAVGPNVDGAKVAGARVTGAAVTGAAVTGAEVVGVLVGESDGELVVGAELGARVVGLVVGELVVGLMVVGVAMSPVRGWCGRRRARHPAANGRA